MATLRIGIDIRPLAGASGRRGVGTYVRGLLSGLDGLSGGEGAEIVLFGNGLEPKGSIPASMRCVRLRRPRRGITLWDQAAWFPVMARRRLSVLHSPFYAVPWLRPRGCRVVQTVHDLTPLAIEGSVSARNERIFRANFRLARTADRVIVPSQATMRDVAGMLGIRKENIVVIHEACDIGPEDIARADAAAAAVRARLGLTGRRYLLHTGGHDRVKNLARLLEAFAPLARASSDLDLVITGEHSAETGRLIRGAAAIGLLARVRLPGWIPRDDLIALYRGASVLVYPSLAEGFGIPLMEAMACGTPAVAAASGALPEVAGDACLLVAPEDAPAISAAISGILGDPGLAQKLSHLGRARAAQFSWRETARRTLEVYREVAA